MQIFVEKQIDPLRSIPRPYGADHLGVNFTKETVDAMLFWRQLCVAFKFQGRYLQEVNCGLSICLRLDLNRRSGRFKDLENATHQKSSNACEERGCGAPANTRSSTGTSNGKPDGGDSRISGSKILPFLPNYFLGHAFPILVFIQELLSQG